MKPLLSEVLSWLEANRRRHYYCEDEYYNCPKLDDVFRECKCGADEKNAEIDALCEKIRKHLTT
jgi:hypothetical protein